MPTLTLDDAWTYADEDKDVLAVCTVHAWSLIADNGCKNIGHDLCTGIVLTT